MAKKLSFTEKITLKNKARMIIADDHPIFLYGISKLIAELNFIEIVAKATNGMELVTFTNQLKPDIILTDIGMPILNGIDATRMIKELHPDIKIFILSYHQTEDWILMALDADADGYMDKDITTDDLMDIFVALNEDEKYFSKRLTTRLKVLITNSNYSPYKKIEHINFDQREIKIIECICDDMQSKEIANALKMSVKTVDNYKTKLRAKLNVNGSVGIAIYAIKHKLINVDLYKFKPPKINT